MLKYKVFSMVAKFIVPDALRGIQIGDNEDMVTEQITAGIITEKADNPEVPKVTGGIDPAKPGAESTVHVIHKPLMEALAESPKSETQDTPPLTLQHPDAPAEEGPKVGKPKKAAKAV
jgi:hypothetical protein